MGEGAFCEKDSLADSVLNHVFARLDAEVGVVGACDGDWVMGHMKELDTNFLAKFCNILMPFEPVNYWCIVSSLCIVLSHAPCGLLKGTFDL